MNNIKILLVLIYITSAISEECSFITATPSMANIPDIFNSAKFETATTSSDIQTALISDSISKYPDLYLYSTFSNLPFASGRLSCFGSDHCNTKSGKFDFQLHKLYYNRKINDYTVGLGIGYDYNENVSSEYDYFVYDYSESDIEIYRNLKIKDIVKNTIYANLNGALPITDKKDFLIGADFYYTTKRGFEYVETYNKYTHFFSYSSDAVSYYDYSSDAYDYKHCIGLSFLKNILLKKKRENLLLLSLLWEFEKQYSEPKYLKNIQSYFVNREPDNIQFSGTDNSFNALYLKFIFLEKYPDLINSPRVKLFNLPWCQVAFNRISMTLTAESNHYRKTTVNRWVQSDGIRWGKTERDYKKKPLALLADHSFNVLMFRYLYANLRYYSDKTLFLYEKYEEIYLDFLLRLNLGVKFPIKNKYLFDVKYSLGTMNYNTYIDTYNSYYRYIYSAVSNPAVLIRISLLN